MTWGAFDLDRAEALMLWGAIVVVLVMATAVLVERVGYLLSQLRQERLEAHYLPLIRRALRGDEEARRSIAASPARHRLTIAALLLVPLIEDRDPARIAATREITATISLSPVIDRYLNSQRWWRRMVALHALGVMQARERTAAIVAALDDPNEQVRAAALDALTDLRDPASLTAIVVRLHDPSLHRGRRAAALAAFGPQCEPFLLDLSHIDPAHRVNYAHALSMCGTEQSRPTLLDWTSDSRTEVRAAAFAALAHVGLDDVSARRAVEALDSADAPVRATAAQALNGWTRSRDAAASLADHLDDSWTVAVMAARSLRSMGPIGVAELQARARQTDTAGLLARQMLWEEAARL